MRDLIQIAEQAALTELTLNKAKQLLRRPSDRIASTEEWLHQQGFRPLGSGNFGSVWSDDSRAVVKVFNHDPCYTQFVKFCRDNRGDPHLPRISKVFSRPDDGGVVFMEKLSPLPNDRSRKSLAIDMQAYMQNLLGGFSPNWWGQRLLDQHPSVAATLEKLARAFEGSSNCLCDLTPTNVMLRGSEPVIVDPFLTRDQATAATNEPRFNPPA